MTGQVGNDDQFFEFQSHGDHLRSKFRKVVFVGVADFSDEAVNMQPFDHARDPSTAFFSKFSPQVFVLEAADGEFPTCYGFEEQLVLIVKEIEAFVRTLTCYDRFRDLIQFLDPGTGVINGGNEFEISAVGCKEKVAEGWQRVDPLFHLGQFPGLATIPVFYQSVVLEE